MKTKLIRIGNSKGILIPSVILHQANLTEEVVLAVNNDGLLITPAKKKRKPREGWDEKLKLAKKETKHRENPWNNITNDFDNNEWTW